MHVEYTRLMSLALDKEATPAQATDLRRHLATCPECSALWQQWQVIDARLARAPMLAAPAGFAAGVQARLTAAAQRRRQSYWLGSGLLIAWGVVLAALLAVAGMTVWWGMHHPLEVSVILSSAAILLSNLSRLLRTMETAVGVINGAAFVVGGGLLVSLTGALALLWVWVMSNTRHWLRPAMWEVK